MVGLAKCGPGEVGFALGRERVKAGIGPAAGMLSGLDEVRLGEFEPLSHAPAGLRQRSLCGVDVLIAGTAADRRSFPSRSVDLLLLPFAAC